MTEEWFPVEAKSPLFAGLDGVQVVFHGINKSGSLSMANVLRRALVHQGRGDDMVSHYHSPGMPLDAYRDLIDARSGRFLAVAHYLYGYLRPVPHRLWITQFRHPLPRVLSTYQWIKNKHVKAHRTAEAFDSLPVFVTKSKGIGHSQVLQFGRGFGRFAKSKIKRTMSGEALFELSVEALEREVAAIGIAEYFEESIFTFAALLGIDQVDSWAKDERNTGRSAVDELTPAELDQIRNVFHWDYMLYDWAVAKFREQCARIEFGPSLERYKATCEGQYKDRLIGDSADDAVTRWLNRAR